MRFDKIPCAPMLLIGFNRPDFMAEQIDAVRGAAPKKIYIAVDGPRVEKSGEAEKCRAVQECVKLIDWPCEIKTLFREKNLGCKYGVSGAITWFFENEEAGIILEDDCRPTIDFLRFASEMLVRYKYDERIGAVCGFNSFNLQSNKNASYHFSRHLDIWGWASWRRVWQKYDVEMRNLDGRINGIIDSSDMTAYYKRMYKRFANDLWNGLSTWDLQFSFVSLDKGWLNIVPAKRLVANVGLADTRATHTGCYIYWGNDWSRAGSLEFPLVHPKEIVCDDAADRLHERIFGAFFPRGLTWLGTKFPSFRNAVSNIGPFFERLTPFLFGR